MVLLIKKRVTILSVSKIRHDTIQYSICFSKVDQKSTFLFSTLFLPPRIEIGVHNNLVFVLC